MRPAGRVRRDTPPRGWLRSRARGPATPSLLGCRAAPRHAAGRRAWAGQGSSLLTVLQHLDRATQRASLGSGPARRPAAGGRSSSCALGRGLQRARLLRRRGRRRGAPVPPSPTRMSLKLGTPDGTAMPGSACAARGGQAEPPPGQLPPPPRRTIFGAVDARTSRGRKTQRPAARTTQLPRWREKGSSTAEGQCPAKTQRFLSAFAFVRVLPRVCQVVCRRPLASSAVAVGWRTRSMARLSFTPRTQPGARPPSTLTVWRLGWRRRLRWTPSGGEPTRAARLRGWPGRRLPPRGPRPDGLSPAARLRPF